MALKNNKTPAKSAAVKPQAAKKPAPKAVATGKAEAGKARPAAKPVAAPPSKKIAATAKSAPVKPSQPAKVVPIAKGGATTKPAAPAPAAPVKSALAQKAPVAAKPAAPLKAPATGAAPKPAPVLSKPGQPITVPPRAAAPLLKTGTPKLTAPVMPSPHKALAEKALAQRQAAAAPASAAAPAQPKKPVSQRHGFKKDEFIVYPAHGVGRITGIEEQEIAGMALELFVITFDKEKLTLRVPTAKLQSVGMRKLADEDLVKKAMDTLKGRARIKRTMWSRRAQEYVAKINSGDLISIAEVVRDLYRSEAQPEQSYSERQLYEDALDRMSREIAAVEKLDERNATQRITEVLSKSAKGRRIAEEAEAEAEAEASAA